MYNITFRSIWYSRETERQSSSERVKIKSGLKLPSNFTLKNYLCTTHHSLNEYQKPLPRWKSRTVCHLSKRVQQMNEADCPYLSPEEWKAHKKLIADAIVQMENYLATPTMKGSNLSGAVEANWSVARNDYRNLTTVHFVAVDLLKLGCATPALCKIFLTGLINWLEVCGTLSTSIWLRFDSWICTNAARSSWVLCQHYFGQTLVRSFLVLTLKARSELGNVVRLLVYIWKF